LPFALLCSCTQHRSECLAARQAALAAKQAAIEQVRGAAEALAAAEDGVDAAVDKLCELEVGWGWNPLHAGLQWWNRKTASPAPDTGLTAVLA
jgi:hypothetical protein